METKGLGLPLSAAATIVFEAMRAATLAVTSIATGALAFAKRLR
jgi:hypothetical protein